MKKSFIPVFLIYIILTLACAERNEKQIGVRPADKNSVITVAERFTIQKTDTCTIVTVINPWQGAKEVRQTYYLVEKGKTFRAKVNPSMVIDVPLKKVICMSTTHLAMISALGEEDAIAGVSGTAFIYNKSLTEMVKNGRISEIGYDAGINNELILSINPDLLMIYGIGSESAGYLGKITELGIKIMFNADYLETDPLGKSEWIKLFGALFCKEERADSIYMAITASYNKIKAFVSSREDEKPDVLLGLPFRDTWFISPGNSYISKLIEDAGGNYLWHNMESSVSMPSSLEKVYLKSLKAEFWLNIGSVNSKNEIAVFNPRLKDIPCFIKGNLYNNNKRITSEGSNDYWESGTLNPQIILKDIASILHPGIFGDYELFYYRRIE